MSRLFSMLKVPRGSIKGNPATKNQRDGFHFALRKFAYNWSGFNRYGLYSHDLFDEENLIVKEALRRLPTDVLDARTFRIIRAAQLDFLKIHLPKEKWLTFEQDLAYRYLGAYLEEVIQERREIYEFGCVNYKSNHWPAFEVK
ncbi:cytochrome b-c1 complex subunit 7 [Andrena cerasifolii]|uniref:cytochrome b-c1 complex subunit 7 n=1 Tax=Andrena cerasifolii TaxID=2819439 RepID=UPI0040384B5C